MTVTHAILTQHTITRRPPLEGFVPFPFRSAKRHQRTSATQLKKKTHLVLAMNSHHNDFHFDFDEEQSSAPPAKQQQQQIIYEGKTMPGDSSRHNNSKKRLISRPNRNDVLCGRGEAECECMYDVCIFVFFYKTDQYQ